MAWIEAHQSLRRHPKLLHLSRLVKTKRLPLISHLMCLWWWALDYAEDGYLAQFDDETIAEGAEWTKDAAEFVAALRTARWLDDDGKLHNWERYVGRLLDQRATSTKQRGGRARAEAADRDDRGRFVSVDQQEASTDQHGDSAGSSTVDQHEPAVQLTEPDLTVPNQPTEPDLTSTALARPEVDDLCSLLADRIEANTGRRPTITSKWRDECRLLLDRDRRSPAFVEQVIQWATADPFWNSNILGMPKLREKFDQLAMRMNSPNGKGETPAERLLRQGREMGARHASR